MRTFAIVIGLILTGCGAWEDGFLPASPWESQAIVPVAQEVIESMDQDDDGVLSTLEWGDQPFPIALDANRDGVIDAGEYAEHLAQKDQRLQRPDDSFDFQTFSREPWAGFASVFPNVSALPRRDQSLIKKAVGLFLKGFPDMLDLLNGTPTDHFGQGVKVVFVLDDPRTPTFGVTDHPDFARLRGKKTPDGRLWDVVEGIADPAGRTAITLRSLQQSHRGERGNVFIHEFAHTLHFFVVGSPLERQIARLYREAKRRGRFMDPYSAVNASEYFAQGVEAYLQVVPKKPSRQDNNNNSPKELKREDPALFAFVESLFGPPPD